MTSPAAQTQQAPEDRATGEPPSGGLSRGARRGTDAAAVGEAAVADTPSPRISLDRRPPIGEPVNRGGRSPRGIGSITSSREVTAQEISAARRVTGPINDGRALGVVPRVKANTDLGKASHSGRQDAPIAWSLDDKPSAEVVRTSEQPRPRSGHRLAQVSARLKATAQEELRHFPIEQAVAWFLAGVAVALAILIATT